VIFFLASDSDECCIEGIEKEMVAEVYMGNVIQTSLGQNPARQAAVFAGLSVILPSSICYCI